MAGESLAAEKSKLADATRAHYTDELGDEFKEAERRNRFNLARRGLMGGSAEVDTNAELAKDRDLGATRLDEAVRRAVAGLESSREQERLNAVSLVNSGSGESAVLAASRGLQNAFQNASSQQKANLFEDLFTTGADAVATRNENAQLSALAERYRNQLATFFPSSRSSSGRVTASS